MTDPISAAAIATLVCQQFIQTSTGELATKFTADAIALMGKLRKTIWDRLRGKPKADDAIKLAEKGEQKGVDAIAALLGAEMLDEEFATLLRNMAQQINASKIIDQSSMTMNVSDDAVGFQNQISGGEVIQAQNVTINKT